MPQFTVQESVPTQVATAPSQVSTALLQVAQEHIQAPGPSRVTAWTNPMLIRPANSNQQRNASMHRMNAVNRSSTASPFGMLSK